jgi:GNAT superfamily N-acetyltransferase
MDHPYNIRRARESEVQLYIDWGNSSGWNMNPFITQNFHKEYPDGWFLGEISESTDDRRKVDSDINRKVIALLYCTKYPSKIGFIGYFMVSPEYRGKGYGHRLFQFVLDNFLFNSENPCSAAGLFSASSAESYYRKFGFETKETTLRFRGKINPILLTDTVRRDAGTISTIKGELNIS